MASRREALRQLLTFVAGSPLFAEWMIADQREGTLYPPTYSDEVMGPVSLQEIEEAAKKKIHKMAYDFIAGGVEDEVTLRANREALNRIFLRPRVMVDVSKIDPSVELLGKKMEFPNYSGPDGWKKPGHSGRGPHRRPGSSGHQDPVCRREWCVDEQAGGSAQPLRCGGRTQSARRLRTPLRAMGGAPRIQDALRFASRWTISTSPTVSAITAIGLTTDTCKQASRVRMSVRRNPVRPRWQPCCSHIRLT